MDSLFLGVGLLGYVALGRLTMRQLNGARREAIFSIINLAGVYFFLFHGHRHHSDILFAIYVLLIVFQYIMLRAFAERQGWLPWLSFFTPIAALVLFHYIPAAYFAALGHAFGMNWRAIPDLVGISYLAFRSSRLVLEVRNGAVKIPNAWEYLNFCFRALK